MLQPNPCQPGDTFVPGAQRGPVASGEAEGSCPMEFDPLHDLEGLISDSAHTIVYDRNAYGGPNPHSLGERGRATPSARRTTRT